MSDPPSWLAPPPPSAPPPPPPPPLPAAPPPAPETPGAPQMWGKPPAARGPDTRWIPVVGGIVLVIAVGLVVRGFLFPGYRTPPSYPTPTPTPAGVEYARASAFWNDTEVPALAAVIKSAPAITKNCKGRLSAVCQAAIVATDEKLQYAITVINNGDIPACLTTHVTRYKSDLLAMDGGLQVALIGYKAGDIDKVDQGLSLYHDNSLSVSQDAAAVANDVKVLCN